MSNKAITRMDIDADINAVSTIIQNIIEKNKISFSAVIELLRERRKEEKIITFPVTILKNRSLGILEAITKYLKEEHNLRYSEIADLLNRDDRVVWVTYNKAKKKLPKKFMIDKSSLLIPVSIFTNKELGPLKNLTLYLKDNLNLKYREIAKMLDRDNRTIWTSYNMAKKKK